MNLEDSFGDVVRKARRGQKITERSLSKACGLTPVDIEKIESYQLVPPEDAILKMADYLGLKPDALVNLAYDRYHPQIPPLETWGNIHGFSSEYSDFEVNTFIIWDRASKEAALFDTGTDFGKIREAVDDLGLNLTTLALTHTHRDHVEVIDDVRQEFQPRVIASPKEPVNDAELVSEGFKFNIGSLNIEVRETDGHSPGGLTFVITGYDNAPDVAVVGDAIFAGSAGGAVIDYKRLHSNIKRNILSLPDDTLLLPGHGPLTTVGQEKVNNPFAR